MNTNQKNLIKATIPFLKTNGTDLTKHFYATMLSENPELNNLFNISNQASGRQQNVLANTVLAYAENIEKPTVLINILKGIGNKHVSLNIHPEQYKIVGHYLISSIKAILGDAATAEIIEAWTEAYNELAQIMISLEDGMYQSKVRKTGGWKGWRTFIISDIVEESAEIKSFYLKPKDKGTITDYHPGQYISVKTFVPELQHEQPRQYSLSSAFNPEYYRISVKKDQNNQHLPDGIVSNILHKKNIGDEIEVSAPSGVFHLDTHSENPMVLISGGVGITPLFSMLEANKNSVKKKQLYGCIAAVMRKSMHLKTI
ncbi:nitric oxide dioxygenase [Chryseobacterium sp. RU37D]|uniref:globin domain-containing protein n=1 Tax=Chryseobacterium sp. RU37D TaxID=1907397 RepID=UPI00095422F4|nr:globin domain-containing protein [Chryseobacterium sp. RU37D]SIQ24315.1 nitric oxide dioxygenase [Chryseobacterium sp. RU37D]